MIIFNRFDFCPPSVFLPYVACLLSSACMRSGSGSPPAQAGHYVEAPGSTPAANEEHLGAVNGTTIAIEQLLPETREAMADMDNEAAQRRLHLLWSGFEEVVERQLLVTEAAKRGVDVAQLLKSEVEEKFSPVTDGDVKQFYEDAAGSIGVPFDTAAPHIRKRLERDRKSDLRAVLVSTLRSAAEIRYSMPVPNFHRRDIDTGGAPRKGGAKARVTIVEFSDFECPYCADGRKVLDQVSAAYGERVSIVFRDFPLDRHLRAQPAAEAAQCAHEQDNFWAYHDLLFDNARALQDDDLRQYALDLKLDMDAFASCLASDRPAKLVRRHKAEGVTYGVNGTPAIFINGVKLIGLLPLPLMRIIIDAELAR